MFSSPLISKRQGSRFQTSEPSLTYHATFPLLSSQQFSTVPSPQITPYLHDFPLNNPTKQSTGSTPLRDVCVDRFIPVRADPVKRKLLFDLHEEPPAQNSDDAFSAKIQHNAAYRHLLEKQVLGLHKSLNQEISHSSQDNICHTNRLLNFKNPHKDSQFTSSQLTFPFPEESSDEDATSLPRKIPDKPCRVLEAPYLEDDYYLNLLDWSYTNIVAVALKDTMYLWSGDDGIISRLSQMDNYSDIYTSVGWDSTGTLLATGISNGKIEIWDPVKMRVVRSDLEDHTARVGCLAWNSNNVLASGSMDNSIYLRDMRIRGPNSTITKLRGHKYEVCGLKWSPNNFQLASGGNDNKIFIWNARKGAAEAKFGDHKAAVKALTWSPHQNGLLLTGGGNNDKTIKFWNTLTMKNVKSVYTASQVCNLLFSKNSNEFVSTHGFNNNHVIIWKYPELSKVSILEGHTSRVLYLGLSPDGETIVTGAGASDETLRFWSVFPPIPQCESSSLMPGSTDLR